MQVDLFVFDALVVDHVRDVVDVDAAGGDVGGHQDVNLVVAEGPEGLLPGTLAKVAVNGGRSEPAVHQFFGHLGGGALGLGEDDGAATAACLQDAGHHFDLVHAVGAVDQLADVALGQALIVRISRTDVRGLGHVAAGHGDDRAGHGCREQQGLADGGGPCNQCLDVRQEAEVQHFVGLVEDDDLDVLQAQVLLLVQVDQAAGGADNDLDALLQGIHLRLIGAAAVNGRNAGVALPGGVFQVLGNLDGELPGWHDHQRLRSARDCQLVEAGVVASHHALQRGDAEAQGLAGARLGLADDVVAGEGHRQRHSLDGEGVGDSGVGQGLDDVGADVVVRERFLLDLVRLFVRDDGLFRLDRFSAGFVGQKLVRMQFTHRGVSLFIWALALLAQRGRPRGRSGARSGAQANPVEADRGLSKCWHWGPAGVSQDRVGAGLLNSKIMEINDRASITTPSV
ncbi:hypothetical protein D9M72_412750 [compost metagenome]